MPRRSDHTPSNHRMVSTYGHMFHRVHHFAKAGDRHKGHYHHVDHVTILARGGIQITFGDGQIADYWAPNLIEIDKDVQHQITALEDDTLYICSFPQFGPDGEIVGAAKASMRNGMSQIDACMKCVDGNGCGTGGF